jgi:hypothetical protein
MTTNSRVIVTGFEVVSCVAKVAKKRATSAMPAGDRDVLTPQDLERTTWREYIVAMQRKPRPIKASYNITIGTGKAEQELYSRIAR